MSIIVKPSFIRALRAAAVTAAGALALGACNDKPAPQFEPTGTGSVSGQLFYDADNNGQFTPVGGDTLLRNVSVALFERGTTTMIASGQTTAQGTFDFTGVPVGTHDLRIATDSAVTGPLVFCTNPVKASVYVDENLYVQVPAKLGCVISIMNAKSKPSNSTVTIAGIVTAGQGTYRTAGDNAYIQDATSGIQLFGLPPALNLHVGDSVEVTGVLTPFSGEFEITSPKVAANVKHGVTVPAPLVRTGTQVAATSQGSADVGRLLVVRGVTVGAFTGTGSGRNANATDATGSFQIRLDGNALTNIGTAYFQAGKCYDVVGVLGQFNGTAQLKPRTTADITEVPCS